MHGAFGLTVGYYTVSWDDFNRILGVPVGWVAIGMVGLLGGCTIRGAAGRSVGHATAGAMVVVSAGRADGVASTRSALASLGSVDISAWSLSTSWSSSLLSA